MSARDSWRTLIVCRSFDEAALVATSICSMEFDARVCDAGGVLLADGVSPEAGECIVEVPDEQWPDLIEIIDEVLAEQREFDAELVKRDCQVGRGQRLALLILTLVIMVLATLRLIDL